DPSFSASTYLGGTGQDIAQSVALDPSDNVYVAGVAYSLDFPTTTGAFQTTKGDSNSSSYGDAFVTKFNAGGGTVAYSTYLGGASSDFGSAIAVDSAGVVYFGGSTGSSNFPVKNAYRTSPGSGFLAKIGSSGSSLTWSTYYTTNPTAIGL